jgi:hypothetical protein
MANGDGHMGMTEERGFRALYGELTERAAHERPHDVLWSWLERAQALLDALRPFAGVGARTRPYRQGEWIIQAVLHSLYEFYALSRVSDILLLPYQRGNHAGSWPWPRVGLDERTAFFEALGFHRVLDHPFHPFYHEIVDVEPAVDEAEPITVVGEVWPGLMLDDLMFCRAGGRVRGGARHIRQEVAEHSTLYWAYMRRNRPADDLSHGWGSNSQWATMFRRDYTDGAHFYYNVDGHLDARLPDTTSRPNSSREELEPDERVELLTNRCFIRCPKWHDNRWPYDDTFVESNHAGHSLRER